jgi:uncharacterized protein (DUF58 family)
LQLIKKYISPLYVSNRFYAFVAASVMLFVCRFFLAWLGFIPFLFVLMILVALIADYVLLFNRQDGIYAKRTMAERFSNGDENDVRIDFENRYSFPTFLEVIDEVPNQFQRRDVLFRLSLKPKEQQYIQYSLRPVKRGEYNFGKARVFVHTTLGLLKRRYTLGKDVDVPVYPSYLQLRKYQLMAISNRLNEYGMKKIRRFGHSMEFEQIKEYVQGDDYRTLNWQATARKGQLMVNTYSDEKSQQVYCAIDKSRVMKMPFNELSLLDYAINASLVLSNVALSKQDKAGLITFSENIGSFLKADKKALQMQSVLETLYNQKTRYLESDYEKLYTLLKTKVTQRSLVVLFTNFESIGSMHRQLPYLRKIASQHLLVVVFFENTELDEVVQAPAETVEKIYTKTIAEQFVMEKKLIVKELNRYGIISVLTKPKDLTVNTLNKYLEIKARNLI